MITIEHYDMVDLSPAIIMIHEGCLELARKGYMDTLHVYWDDKVIALRIDSDLVGVMTYRKIQHTSSLWISLSYIDPQHRGAGLYKKLYAELVVKAKEEKVRFIDSGTDVNNHQAQRAFASVGRKVTSYSYRSEVK